MNESIKYFAFIAQIQILKFKLKFTSNYRSMAQNVGFCLVFGLNLNHVLVFEASLSAEFENESLSTKCKIFIVLLTKTVSTSPSSSLLRNKNHKNIHYNKWIYSFIFNKKTNII